MPRKVNDVIFVIAASTVGINAVSLLPFTSIMLLKDHRYLAETVMM